MMSIVSQQFNMRFRQADDLGFMLAHTSQYLRENAATWAWPIPHSS